MQPPVPKRRPHRLVHHGITRVDDWFWLNQREDPEVIAHLEAENAYTVARLASSEDLQETIFRELRERIPQDDASVPVKIRDWWYLTRTEDGKNYPIHCRRRTFDGDDAVILDENQVAEGQDYCDVGARSVGTDQDLMAYAVDLVGRRVYEIRFRRLDTGEELPDRIEGTSGDLVWAEDGRTIFYTRKDPRTLRPDRVYRHVLGTDPADDACVFHDTDDAYYVSLGKTTSREYLLIGSETTLRSEIRFLPAHRPLEEWKVFLPREGEHEYDVDHYAGWWWITSNENARNFRLLRAPVDGYEKSNWEEVIPHRDDVLFGGVVLFREHMVAVERREALRRLRVLDHDGREQRVLEFQDEVYDAALGTNLEPDLPAVRVLYSSMGMPPTTLEFDLATGRRRTLKVQPVGGGFDPSKYVAARVWAEARDGTRVPISLVRRKDTPCDGRAPLLLYGYGSYGISLDASFSPARISLLDRGWIFAIAHIRGGSDMGRHWYELGRQGHKWNTFHDFIDCAETLIAEKYTVKDRLYCWGGSAGGLLVGCVLNERPDLFAGAIAQVPFVDVVTTMLDDTIPLTTGEYDEWGNPHVKEDFERMLSYSPYDNVKEQDYPHLLVMTGFHDSQVQYWEPAKWVAKLRTSKTDDNLLLFRTDMSSGHGGASGRYDRYREMALQYAFLIERARQVTGRAGRRESRAIGDETAGRADGEPDPERAP